MDLGVGEFKSTGKLRRGSSWGVSKTRAGSGRVREREESMGIEGLSGDCSEEKGQV